MVTMPLPPSPFLTWPSVKIVNPIRPSATLKTTDEDAGDTHTYDLITGGTNFNISGNILQAAKVFDYDVKNSYEIRIRTNDGNGGTLEQNFTIRVTKNQAPTNINLSKTNIVENNALNATIGTLSTTDPDVTDKHTYTLVSGATDFNINGNILQASKVFDSDFKDSYSIRIRTDDGRGGTFEKIFVITIENINHPPTNTQLSKTTIADNNALNATIGTLTSTDPDTRDNHTYTLVLNSSNFNISGNTLRASKRFDYDMQNTYLIRIRTDDGRGGTFEKNFTILITSENKGTMTYNGKIYKTVKIGDQWWMAENLNDEGSLDISSFCYNNDPNNCTTYGRLYNWESAVRMANKIDGWSLPPDEAWQTLEKYLGMNASEAANTGYRGIDQGTKLKVGGRSGFEARLGGYRSSSSGSFSDLNSEAYFWTASPDGSREAYYRNLDSDSKVYRQSSDRSLGYSVRLIKNEAPTNITLSKTSITENNSLNAVIGTLTTTDADASDTHTYTLVTGGDDFNINGNQLRASKAFDYEKTKNYSIKIRTSDSNAGTFEKDFTITINDETETGTMTYNGKTYKTIKIGSQWWLAENLNDATHGTGNSACYFNRDSNCDTYGRLYDWEAAKAIAAKIPGWHLPTDDEWKTLEMFLGMSKSEADDTGWRGSPVGTKLKKKRRVRFWGSPRRRRQRGRLRQLGRRRQLLVEFPEWK